MRGKRGIVFTLFLLINTTGSWETRRSLELELVSPIPLAQPQRCLEMLCPVGRLRRVISVRVSSGEGALRNICAAHIVRGRGLIR
jgi:hypothetical protein